MLWPAKHEPSFNVAVVPELGNVSSKLLRSSGVAKFVGRRATMLPCLVADAKSSCCMVATPCARKAVETAVESSSAKSVAAIAFDVVQLRHGGSWGGLSSCCLLLGTNSAGFLPEAKIHTMTAAPAAAPTSWPTRMLDHLGPGGHKTEACTDRNPKSEKK